MRVQRLSVNVVQLSSVLSLSRSGGKNFKTFLPPFPLPSFPYPLFLFFLPAMPHGAFSFLQFLLTPLSLLNILPLPFFTSLLCCLKFTTLLFYMMIIIIISLLPVQCRMKDLPEVTLGVLAYSSHLTSASWQEGFGRIC